MLFYSYLCSYKVVFISYLIEQFRHYGYSVAIAICIASKNGASSISRHVCHAPVFQSRP